MKSTLNCSYEDRAQHCLKNEWTLIHRILPNMDSSFTGEGSATDLDFPILSNFGGCVVVETVLPGPNPNLSLI